SLGADEVIDYTRDDYARAASRYDVIFDVAGGESYRRVKHSLAPSGVFMTTVPAVGILLRMPFARRGRRRGLVAFTGLRNTAAKQRDLLET
ncbi:zinc-binding dehydrogenase, partial [Rhizobium johnstonii]|uniref:zinc-binding dehydrogenase n=1 Tax=Rhizobium johnstonii TaxID=3019933 RepID=UPI003F9DB9FD